MPFVLYFIIPALHRSKRYKSMFCSGFYFLCFLRLVAFIKRFKGTFREVFINRNTNCSTLVIKRLISLK